MTLGQLVIFVAVAEREHVTHAADALNLTQSAVSAAIASLERGLGSRLFHRVGRNIAPTEGGRFFFLEARAILDRADPAARAMREVSELKRGRISIKACQTSASYYPPQRHATTCGIRVC
jgi:DNA-binding transcriptional LysR family regulator